jgi:seryl-tRNA synthetase
MLDIQLLRKDIDDVVARLSRRGPMAADQLKERFQDLDARRKTLQTAVEGSKAQRNTLAKQIGQLKSKGGDAADLMAQSVRLNEESAAHEAELAKVMAGFEDLLARVPNIPDASVPDGKSADDNVELRRRGTPRVFDFPVKDHVEIGEGVAGIDFEAATKIAGARFYVLKGSVARLHRALGQFMLDVHTQEHGYNEVYVPYMVNKKAAFGTGNLPKFADELFAVKRGGSDCEDEKDVAADFYLIPTAEVPVTNLVMDSIVPMESLPLKYVSHTPCFRSEAGSYGKDTRGMIRVHQFDKVELVQIVHPSESHAAHEQLTANAEAILDKLELPYRTMALCAGDMGPNAVKTYDLEVWLPAQNTYREISSCSNFEAFQARRMQARFRNAAGKPELVHTLNGSGLAVGRTLVAILENCQNADGSVTVPAVLRPYMGGVEKITRPQA